MKVLPPIAAIALGLGCASAQDPVITEFVAINASGLLDGDGNTSDWMEIHNPAAAPLDISGYRLTDDPELARFVFPANTILPANGYLIVFASGQPTSDYIDGGGFFHTNFGLSGNGEYLALQRPDGSVVQEFAPEYPGQFDDVSYGLGSFTETTTTAVIATGAPSRWLVPTSDIGTGWQLPGFDDSAWNAASTGIGFGFPGLVGAGGDTGAAMRFISTTAYLRIPFPVDDPAAVSALTLRMKYEDGFAAFLNGIPVASANAPVTLSHTSSASAEHPDVDAVVFETFDLAATGALVAGENVLAIHGLNFNVFGTSSSDFLALPELDVTTSEGGTGPTYGFYPEPTPGAANTTPGFIGFVADTKFSHDRGYYDAPFDLAITTATENATILYTTDGTPPSETNGTPYTAPITIEGTTVLRAIAVRTGYQETNIDTQTYLFVDDIVRQSNSPGPGYPSTWAGRTADYEMDPEVVDDPAYADQFDEAFAALPTLSLVFDPDAFFSPSTGIYQNPQSEGDAWERPLSAEFFVTDGSEPGFRTGAGVRVQGGSSRSPDTPKHSLSLRFRAEYGAGKLRYPLFENSPGGDSAVEEFDLLQLRPEYNFGWMHRHYYQAERAQYGRDQWASDLFIAMGNLGSHGRWTHLFLNGIYWGVYDLHERPDADHMANYLGGTSDDYDTVNSSVATNGDLVAYNAMMDIAYSASIDTPATYAAIQEYLDIDAFIDYMLLNAYVGNRDWDGHNWRAGRRREAGAPYYFFPWDTEFAISNVGGGVFSMPSDFEERTLDFRETTLQTNVLNNNGNRRPTGLHRRLALNAEYRLRYADHVHRHMFNGGTLTPEKAADAWNARAVAMTTAVVAESARWGDFRRDVDSGRWSPAQFDLYTRDGYFLPSQAWILDFYLPERTDIVVEDLENAGLYPATAAPVFSQHGGAVPAGFQLQIDAADTVSVYYTTDGSDPRDPGAFTLVPGSMLAIDQSLLLKARALSSGGEWSALNEALFTVSLTDLRITEIMYRPTPDPLAEFLEITNTGAGTLALTGLRFSAGITFDFDLHSTIASLPPGARLLIVRDLAAFQGAYGNSFDPLIAGTFQNDTALSNNGETLTLEDGNGNVILTFRYDEGFPWPASADGGGRSLVHAGGDPADPLNWRPSLADGGNPGSSDALVPSGDLLVDYAPTLALTPVSLTVTRRLGADHLSHAMEFSEDLADWSGDLVVPELVARSSTGGIEQLVYSLALPVPTERLAARMRVAAR